MFQSHTSGMSRFIHRADAPTSPSQPDTKAQLCGRILLIYLVVFLCVCGGSISRVSTCIIGNENVRLYRKKPLFTTRPGENT